MDEKKKMRFSDKIEYFWYHLKTFLIFILGYFIIVTLFMFFGFLLILKANLFSLIFISRDMNIIILVAIVYGFGLLLGLIKLLKTLNVLLRRNVYIIEGHIFKRHTFKRNNSDSTTTFIKMVKAISNDKSVTTGWKECSRKLYREIGTPVTIVVYKGKGLDFYI